MLRDRKKSPSRPGLSSAGLARSALLLAALALTLLVGAAGCSGGVPPLRPELQSAAAGHDPVALSEALEQLIDAGTVTDDDREAAYHAVSSWPVEETAAFHFGRAAITGRLAQVRGLSAIGLVGEVETHARRSIELDAKFRDGAATRMLGTLYVLAPSSLLDHGDSETGLELLEKVRDAHPDDPQNHLRVAEGYIALGDSDPAHDPLCFALARRAALRADDQRLLDRLVEDEGGADGLDCPAPPAAAPSAPPAPTPAGPAAEPSAAPTGTGSSTPPGPAATRTAAPPHPAPPTAATTTPAPPAAATTTPAPPAAATTTPAPPTAATTTPAPPTAATTTPGAPRAASPAPRE